MNSPSAFQQQYPLSSKKLWKKVISRLVAFVVWSVLLSICSTALISVLVVGPHADFGISWLIGLVIVLFAAFFVTFLVLYVVYVSAYIRRYYYEATEQYLTIQKGVFAPTEIHVPYQKIQDVYVDQDILDRLMGLYDVHIASATVASGIEAHIDGVDATVAEGLKNLLLGKLQYGGTLSSSASGNSMPQQSAQPQVAEGPQAGVFSSVRYPIQTAWLVIACISSVWPAFLWTVILYFFTRGKSMSMLYTLSFNQGIWIFGLLFVVFSIWRILWKATFYFEFLPQFVLVRDGILRREEKHVPYRTLQDVLLRRGLVDQLLGLCTVVIENAAMGSSKMGRASRIILPGQSFEKGTELVKELNRILGQTGSRGTGL